MKTSHPSIPEAPAAKSPPPTKILITPQRPILGIPLRELWEYRDLVWQMVRRDIVTQHKQTALGPLWFFAQPILASVVYTIIFQRIAGIPTDDIPPFLFYLAGTTIWSLLAITVTRSASTFTANAAVFSKIYFPRLAVPLSQSLVALFLFLIQMLIFIGFYIYFLLAGYPVEANYRIIIIPFLVLQLGMLGFGVGILIAAFTTKFRDLQFAVGPGLQLWMYASCIFFPRSLVPPSLQWLMVANPAVSIVEAFRFSVMGRGEVELWQWVTSFALTLAILLVGLTFFRRAEATSMDTV